jgi:hypothetical protein
MKWAYDEMDAPVVPQPKIVYTGLTTLLATQSATTLVSNVEEEWETYKGCKRSHLLSEEGKPLAYRKRNSKAAS